MNKFENRVAGMFRRGLPEGEQLDLLITWVVMKLADGKPLDSKRLMQDIAATIDRATAQLSPNNRR